MPSRKIVIIGGASAYTPGIIEGFIKQSGDLRGSEIVLQDIDEPRLEIIGRLARRMIEASETELSVQWTADRTAALEGADFLLPQYRVGGLPARAIDEKIPLKYGVIGQETVGPGGLSMALRAIALALKIASEVQRVCPDAWWINYANPSGMVTEALAKHTPVKVIGLCDEPVGIKNVIAEFLLVNPSRLEIDNLGINHCGWIVRLYRDGKEITGGLKRFLSWVPTRLIPDHRFARVLELFRRYGLIPSPYLMYYYFAQEMIDRARRAPKTRAEVIMDQLPGIYDYYRKVAGQRKPALRKRRGAPGHADLATQVIAAIAADKNERHVVNVPGRGSIEDFTSDQVVEVPALVGAAGARPLMMGPLPGSVRDLILRVKACEDLNVEAAVTGSYDRALDAMAAHPLVPSREIARRVLDELLAAHRQYLPQFFPSNG